MTVLADRRGLAEAGGVAPVRDRQNPWPGVALAALLWVAAYNVVEPLSRWISHDALRLPRGSHPGEAVAFFFYDVPKILLLLSGMIFLITIVRSFFSAERARRMLRGKRVGLGNAVAAALGIVTPFCSCSAVPLFIGFVESGIPLGVTFSFLIAAPVINEVALVLLFGMFGWKVAGLYVSSGLAVAIATGLVLGRLRLERYVEESVWRTSFREGADEARGLSWDERFGQARQAVREILVKVWAYVLLGIGVGAGIHGYLPADALAAYMGKGGPWWSVPLVVVAALPLYSNAAGMAPVLQALVEKGAALGTALAFMMAVVGVSLPEIIMLRRVLKPQLIAIFVGVVTVAIILIGYLFNALL